MIFSLDILNHFTNVHNYHKQNIDLHILQIFHDLPNHLNTFLILVPLLFPFFFRVLLLIIINILLLLILIFLMKLVHNHGILLLQNSSDASLHLHENLFQNVNDLIAHYFLLLHIILLNCSILGLLLLFHLNFKFEFKLIIKITLIIILLIISIVFYLIWYFFFNFCYWS